MKSRSFLDSFCFPLFVVFLSNFTLQYYFAYIFTIKAASVGSEDICKVLVNAGALAQEKNSFGNSPLHHACRSRSVDVVRLLLDQGVDINAQNNRGSTALHICSFVASNIFLNNATAEDEDRTNVGRLLSLQKGGTTKRRRRESRLVVDPALQIAAILLKRGCADIDRQDINGYTGNLYRNLVCA